MNYSSDRPPDSNVEGIDLADVSIDHTPGVSHGPLIRWMDRSGLPVGLLAFIVFLSLVFIGFLGLIISRIPDPSIYRNSIAFSAIVSFLIAFYFIMGRGWYRDVISFLEFDTGVSPALDYLEPGRAIVSVECIIALVAAGINLQIAEFPFAVSPLFLTLFYGFLFVQWMVLIFCMDIMMRQLVSLSVITRTIRIDLLETGFYSSLANAMYRFFKLYVVGLCVITLSYLVYTEGSGYGAAEMAVIMMPWYLPGLIFMSLYLFPYNQFRKRVGVVKTVELNRVKEAIRGNTSLLRDSMIAADQGSLRTVDLLAYQDRILAVREWPFTNRIRNFVLFGILPPLTWVIAAFIEILIEANL